MYKKENQFSIYTLHMLSAVAVGDNKLLLLHAEKRKDYSRTVYLLHVNFSVGTLIN